MSAYSLVNGDFKVFNFDDNDDSTITYPLGFGVIEMTDAKASLDRIDEILPEMVETRIEKNLTAMMVAVVDIVGLNSTLLLCGHKERSLGIAAFGGEPSQDGKILRLPGLVSRKKDFVPGLTKAVGNGWKPPPDEIVESKMKRKSSYIALNCDSFPPGLLVRIYDDEDDPSTLKTQEGAS